MWFLIATASWAGERWVVTVPRFVAEQDRLAEPPILTALVTRNQWLIAAGDDHRIWVWDVSDEQLVAGLDGHRDWVRCLATSPDRSLLVSGGNDGAVCVWDLQTLRLVRCVSIGTGAVTSLAFNDSGSRVVLTSFDGQVVSIDTDGTVHWRQQLADRDLRALTMVNEHQQVVVAGRSGAIHVCSTLDGKVEHPLTGHRRRVRAVSWVPGEQTLFSAGEDGCIMAWHWPPHDAARLLCQLPAPIHAMFITDEVLVVGCSDNTLHMVHPQSGERLAEFQEHVGTISAMAPCPDGGFFTAGYDATLRRWRKEKTSPPPTP